jgi:hypothetical protein
MTDGIQMRPRGDALGQAIADKFRAKVEENDRRVQALQIRPSTRRLIKVQLARPDLRVRDETRALYPEGVFEVDPDNLYVARRMMDGVLVQVSEETSPATEGTPMPQEATPAQEATPTQEATPAEEVPIPQEATPAVETTVAEEVPTV